MRMSPRSPPSPNWVPARSEPLLPPAAPTSFIASNAPSNDSLSLACAGNARRPKLEMLPALRPPPPRTRVDGAAHPLVYEVVLFLALIKPMPLKIRPHAQAALRSQCRGLLSGLLAWDRTP